jgi:hypothetical protein
MKASLIAHEFELVLALIRKQLWLEHWRQQPSSHATQQVLNSLLPQQLLLSFLKLLTQTQEKDHELELLSI